MKLTGKQQLILKEVLKRLSQSKFRSKFHLNHNDILYIEQKGFTKIKQHAEEFVGKRLFLFDETIDGKQTPMKGHPVFIAQHATATCCRGCLEKWHSIPKNQNLTKEQEHYIVSLLLFWIAKEMKKKSIDYLNQEKNHENR